MLKTEVELECVKDGSVSKSCILTWEAVPTIALLMRYHERIFLKFLKLVLLGALFALIRAYKSPNFKTMHFRMENCDLFTMALLMRYHKPIFMKVLKLALLGALSTLIRARLGPKMQIFKK